MTYRIPRAAMPVVDLIRATVPRPRTLPVLVGDGAKGVWLRWRRRRGEYCLMGLLPCALSRMPILLSQLPGSGLTPKAFLAGLRMWDRWTDPQAAVDAVWGPKP